MTRWSEAAGRRALVERSGGVCEVTGGRAEHASHRCARSQLGTWSPTNLLHLSAEFHRALHAHPALARAGGWQLESWQDPAEVPVWLTSPWPGWWRLVDPVGDGGAHLVVPVDEVLAPPVLPLCRLTV